ncbi:hypothetical protein theurythT_10460 [Thalassotalea eurytherma]|uniref:Uncharacterized protein n=1 Tax=Thalassotalea eurytherma TaxID=1144278 RepID=A0ABQ6H292_9GAMM|nr:hypothetical protein theurythT_10460 [Thalassotalea eurytherma]
MNLWGFVDLRPKFLAKFIHQFEKSKHQVDAVTMGTDNLLFSTHTIIAPKEDVIMFNDG